MVNEWGAGTAPWLRRQMVNDDDAVADAMPCPFCGGRTLIRSLNDLRKDNVRMELYCDSQMCDARAITIMVKSDGTAETAERPDLRALEAIDSGEYAPKPLAFRSFQDIDDDPTLRKKAILARRTTGRPVIDLRDLDEVEGVGVPDGT